MVLKKEKKIKCHRFRIRPPHCHTYGPLSVEKEILKVGRKVWGSTEAYTSADLASFTRRGHLQSVLLASSLASCVDLLRRKQILSYPPLPLASLSAM